jgi:glycosyltransferase involved in cell wall biosynthesis
MRPKADFHHVYSNPYLLALGRAAKRILHYTTTIEQVPRAYQKAAQRADAVICCSVFIRDQFLHHVPYPAARVFAIPPGVDMDHYHPGDRQASRAALGIPVDETVVLFAGAVHEDKGLIHLVRAMKLLSDTAKLRLLVAGSSSLWGHVGSRDGAGGAEVSAYEQKVAEEAKGVTATFLGKVPYAKMPVVHRAADIFVCPSVWDDPFPLVSLEAMATALPVIGTRKGGIPEAIVEGVNGLLVPPADAEALASALRTLVDSPLLRQEMGQAGLRRVQGFGWQAITAQVQEVYDQVRTGPDRDAASP